MTFTIHLKLAAEGAVHAVDVDGGDTVMALAEEAARRLAVDSKDIVLSHDGVALDDLPLEVAKTMLGEGSEVEAGPSKGFLIKAAAREGDMATLGTLGGIAAFIQLHESPLEAALGGGYPKVVVAEVLGEERWAGEGKSWKNELNAALGEKRFADADDTGITPLHQACIVGAATIARGLIAMGADVDYADVFSGKTPLGFAAHFGHENVAKVLLEAGADKTKNLRGGRIARDLAEDHGHTEIATLLS